MKREKRREIRSDMKRLLANLDERWVRAASSQLCQHLLELLRTPRLATRSHILAWTSFFPGEVDLTAFISDLVEERIFYLPRCHPDFSMVFISVGRDWTQEVEPGSFGIPEPKSDAGNRFDPESEASEAIVIVPGMAFDPLGNRIGRGKGYYDRFLGQPAMSRAKRIGVGWNLQMVDRIAPEAHDIPVDYICTEEGVISADLSES
ncbi:MAG: 5-formyltetrahydrofolate cyclo-ligase [Bdellovibrionales bacterium]|nr:5-formyltetrahydrofolate cyclo-ligase [Bdellovibrionales bacterium]